MGKRNSQLLEELDGRNGVWSIDAWCLQAGMSHVKLGQLDPQPHFTKLGRLKRITESPREYLERVRQLQRAEQDPKHTESAAA